MEENKEQKQVKGWADVVITPDMPLSVIVNFLNVINERLCAIEDIIQIPFNNKMITLTQFIKLKQKNKPLQLRKNQQKKKELNP